MAWDRQNDIIRRTGFVLNPQTTCPIAAGDVGAWLDSSDGVYKLRRADGTDAVLGNASDVQVLAVSYVATAALPTNVYDNGPNNDGVGATLVRTVNGTIGTQDGQTPDVGDVILVTGEVAGLGNGAYVVTVKGSGSAKYKLTRIAAYDKSEQMTDGTIFVVAKGTTYADSTWKQTSASAPAVGTDALVYALAPISIVYGAAGDMAAAGLAAANAAGVSTKIARTDHVHAVSDGIAMLKEHDHVIAPADTTTAATAGGANTLKGGKSGTSGTGGAAGCIGGAGDTTGAGGAGSTRGGAGGSASGTGGAADLTGGAGTAGNANGGAAIVDGGAKNGAGTDGAVNIGATTASAVNIGRAGKLVTFNGPRARGATTDVIADPGTGAAIPVTQDGVCMITTAAAETNTLAIPTYVGQRLCLIMDTRVGGDRVVTSAQVINQAGNTVMTFGAAADMIVLEGMKVAGALRWRVTANDGVALS